MRPLHAAVACLLLPGLVSAVLPATAQPSARPPTSSHPQLSPPEGGPVDDGWLPIGPDGAFSQFEGEPAPGGSMVWPGVRRDARTTRVASGAPVNIQILHLDPDAAVTVQPTLVGGTVGGLAPVTAQSGDPLQGSVAATNGAFWLGDPLGEPNGFFARDGRLISDAETQGAGPRGTVGWTADGQLVVDRIDSVEAIDLAGGAVYAMNGINRGHREFDHRFGDGYHSFLAYTSDYGRLVEMREPRIPPDGPPGPVDLAAVRVAADAWPAAGRVTGTVIGITRDKAATFQVGPGEVLIIGTGTGAAHLDPVEIGQTVTLSTTISALDADRDPVWAGVVRALAGGPMIVKGGQVTAEVDWVDEGFEPHIHSDVRAPRTAIGVTADGRTLMVTADGRRPGISVGFTIAELARYMISLGAVEALSLDGGGSSQMVVDGILRNNPCCDSSVRAVATSLQVSHAEPFDGTHRLQGAGRVDTAAAVARAAFPEGTRHAVLAVASAFPDALAGGPLAATLGGPLLLTAADGVPPVTRSVLADLGVQRVTLLGGPAVIGAEVVADLTEDGITANRLAGDSRIDTSAAIARRLQDVVNAEGGQSADRAFIAAADGFADALVAAGPGGILGMPILLSERDRLHPATASALVDVDEVVLVGGEARLGSGLVADLADLEVEVTRLAGSSRFATAEAVNDWLATQVQLSDRLVVATGDDFPDALAGGPLATMLQAPLMILPGGAIDSDPGAAAYFADLGPRSRIWVLGGLRALSSFQQWQLEQLTG
ncbi:MAG TPA: cell wall-binding repeat-containing protein [Euzebya sp.]|nr:cell wall-binding repeat-containing protein [Euzebya sp.]